MIGTTIRGTSLFLAAVAAQIESAQVQPGAESGLSDWVRVPTPHGHVEVWDAEEVGEHGLANQTYQVRDGGQPTASKTSAGSVNEPPSRRPSRSSAATWTGPGSGRDRPTSPYAMGVLTILATAWLAQVIPARCGRSQVEQRQL